MSNNNDYFFEEIVFIFLGILVSAQLTFLLLKLFNVINWSWWIVSAPFIIESVIVLGLFIYSVIEIIINKKNNI